jgi:hypothetical protein
MLLFPRSLSFPFARVSPDYTLTKRVLFTFMSVATIGLCTLTVVVPPSWRLVAYLTDVSAGGVFASLFDDDEKSSALLDEQDQ